MEKNSRIYVAGHTGMVGSAITRKLLSEGYDNLILRTHEELDLIQQDKVFKFFKKERIEYVFVSAAKVGGIHANNNFRGQFLYENLMIQNNIIHSAHQTGIEKLLFLGSACIYPRLAPQPMNEECLLSDVLEPTNEPYALAKIAGIKLCENYYRQYGDNFISVMPNNLYGPNDNFDLKNSHVLPALMRKFHQAKEADENEVVIWGTGSPKREFLHVDDLADACVFLMKNLNASTLFERSISHINVGSGEEISIHDLALMVKKIVGFEGNLVFDPRKPDGTPRKLLNSSRIHELGWKEKIKLMKGIKETYDWYSKQTKR
jgi:GDP-L-fucose synthase